MQCQNHLGGATCGAIALEIARQIGKLHAPGAEELGQRRWVVGRRQRQVGAGATQFGSQGS